MELGTNSPFRSCKKQARAMLGPVFFGGVRGVRGVRGVSVVRGVRGIRGVRGVRGARKAN